MTARHHFAKLFILLFSFACINYASANQKPGTPKPIPKEGKTYASASIAFNEFRSVSLPIVKSETLSRVETKFPLTGQTYAISAALGTYITDNFKTEVRYGTGVLSDTLDNLLEINMNYYFNWYIGGTIPVTEKLSAYSLLGVSFYDADVTHKEEVRTFIPPGSRVPETEKVRPSPTELDEDLFGTKFSMSWMLGADYQLDKNWYLAFEYGRLLKDTDTNIKVYQGNLQLRYEF